MSELELAAGALGSVTGCPSNDGGLCELCAALVKVAAIAINRVVEGGME